MHRAYEDESIRETFRTLRPRNGPKPFARLHPFLEAEGDDGRWTKVGCRSWRGRGLKDFWLSCGHHLLDRDAGGGLLVTDEFLKVYLARPELAPPPDASPGESALHAALLADPRKIVGAKDIAAITDADARENWELMIAFRDHLLRHPTIEAAYASLVREGIGRTPPLFINQLVHVILRNALDGCDDAYVLRAAELFFREQRMTVHEGSLIAADEETIAGIGDMPLSPLVSMLGLPPPRSTFCPTPTPTLIGSAAIFSTWRST